MVCWCIHIRGEKVPAKSAQTALSHCDHHMVTNCRAPTADAGQTRRRGRRKDLVVHPRRFLELKARPWFAAARTSVVVTGGSRAERSDAVTCGFPHRPRRFYRQPADDAAREPCSAMKTSSCSERNGSWSSRSTRMAAAGAARPGIGRHRPVIQVFRFARHLKDPGAQALRHRWRWRS